MSGKPLSAWHWLRSVGAAVLFLTIVGAFTDAQVSRVERTIHAPKNVVEKALKQLQSATSGRLPALEGFAEAGDRPLSRYRRGYFQCAVQVSAMPSGDSLVKVSAKVTAWYDAAGPAHSGYELLRSNGRIETDLLDQIVEQLSGNAVSAEGKSSSPSDFAASAPSVKHAASEEPTISAPMPQTSGGGAGFPKVAALPSERPTANGAKKDGGVQSEIATLEEVVKNQAHPKNLVAVKKSGTPVVGSPSLSGKVLFAASAHDEFEMLDYNADWVHVRISGLSRAWIWRTSLEMPEGIPDVPRTVVAAAPTAADLFQVSREESAPFPGDWEPLRGKSVKIISVQKVRENEQGSGPSAKLEFAKSLLDKNYDVLAKSPELSGLVLIFDSADGGMIAATLPTIQRWKAGALNDAALWHQCYFDPPETFTLSSGGGGN